MLSSIRGEFKKASFQYLLSNICFSGSSYIINITLPYLLSLEGYADYITLFQIIFTLAFLFEFGICTSYLTFEPREREQIFTVYQVLIYLSLIVISFFHQNIMSIQNASITVNGGLFWLTVLAQLMWAFLRASLLGLKNLQNLNYLSLSVLLLRSISLLLAYCGLIRTDIDHLLFYFYLFPFIGPALYSFFNLAKHLPRNPVQINFMLMRQFFSRSMLNYLSSLFYLISIRFVFIYFAGENDQMIADLGYSYSFIGIFNVFYFSIRTYIISKTELQDKDELRRYINKVSGKASIYFLIILCSAVISAAGYLLKPNYLKQELIVVITVIVLTFNSIFYLGLFNLLSKRLNLIKYETAVNFVRVSVSIAIVVLIFPKNFFLGIIILHLSFLVFEAALKYIVSKQIELRYA